MDDEYLSKCVVDVKGRTVYLYSSEGVEKSVKCDTVDEFMGGLQFVRETCPEERLSYSDPLMPGKTDF